MQLKSLDELNSLNKAVFRGEVAIKRSDGVWIVGGEHLHTHYSAYAVLNIESWEYCKEEKALATLISKVSFRSKHDLNMCDDMYRVTLDMSKKNFMKLSKYFEDVE